jgi:heterodisulfide reductase subunit A-like polyferredoxin
VSDYDVLVVGSGIGGMESALKLGDMGYKVLVVEKEPSVGGKMILLSKVFPTLDCASCISTPKMGATTHHPNVTVFTDSEVEGIARDATGALHVRLHRKPRFVDQSLCTGCRQCEIACTVSVPDQFNGDMVSRHAAYIAFPQAVPQKALIDRAGTSPCTFACPAGVKAHGYVSLVRSGMYEEAFDLVLETTPLAGTLGRACYAPCETQCTRGRLEGAVPIRRLKRFVADAHYALDRPPRVEHKEPNGKRVAVVGSGPAGVTAAWQLARNGYEVKIFEAAPAAGGAMRLSIPSYRLPAAAVERDLANLGAVGVEIVTNSRVDDLDQLRRDGFDAVLVATGTTRSLELGVPGEKELVGVRSALDFLRDIRLDKAPDLGSKVVVVIGGGNVAIDAARSARRLGAVVHLVCLERRAEMPAYAWEVDEALAEGVELHDGWGIASFAGDGPLPSVQSVQLKRCTSVFDGSGKFDPSYDEDERGELRSDAAIVAIGMGTDTSTFPALASRGGRWLQANAATLQTTLPWVFAAGDAVTGPTTIAEAAGHGRKAAHMIDRFLQGLEFSGFDDPLPVVDKDEVLSRQHRYARRQPLASSIQLSPAPSDFAELEAPLTDDEAPAAAGRCLDCGVCSECHECVKACPANAIDLDMRASDEEIDVGAVILSTGYKLFPADLKPQYGYGKYPNVITAVQMDRLLAPTRPYNTVLRPSDGKVPERIAYVMCTGSRDQTVGNPLCSKFCCMYSLKQNQLIMGALPLADVTVHYIDIRAAGKGYDEFFEQTKAMGTTFVKGRVAGIAETEDHDLVLRYEDIDGGGGVSEAEYDLVVLAVGVQPNDDLARLFPPGQLALDDFAYVEEPDEDLNPSATSAPGVFVAGSVSGPMDIPESILHAAAAVVQAAAYLERNKKVPEEKVPKEKTPV